MTIFITIRSKGGPGSGNWGHRGIPGKVGGSSPRGAGMSPTSRRGGKVGADVENTRAHKFLSDITKKGDWTRFSQDDATMSKSNTVQELSDMSGLTEDMTNIMIGQWAVTSNDHNSQALSMQEAVAEEFGVPLSDWQKENISMVNKGGQIRKHLPQGPVKGWGSRDEERALLRAMYNNTQAQLKAAGYKPGDTVSLYRGVTAPYTTYDRYEGRVEKYKGNAMESWSISKSTAISYTDTYGDPNIQGFVLNMHVPVENVLGTARTGFGSLNVGEFVVLGSLSSETLMVYVTEEE